MNDNTNPTILAAVEAMARAISGAPFSSPRSERKATAALTALTTLHPGIGAVLRGEAVVVPREATPEMTKAANQHVAVCTPDGTWALGRDESARCYRAMLAASPYAPTAGGAA